jgi:hypothetical protein
MCVYMFQILFFVTLPAIQLQRIPNVAKAQESWQRAKRENALEVVRQKQHEDMKQVFDLLVDENLS